MALPWQDQEVRFDLPAQLVKVRLGETVLQTLFSVEDTKGNSGDRGQLLVTNLRLLWQSHSLSRVNLSIGLNCIVSVNMKEINSRIRGVSETVFLLTRSEGVRFEFIFTNLSPSGDKLYSAVHAVHRAYCCSRPYRELKLRGAVLQCDSLALRLLPLEQVVGRHEGVWNLAADHGSLGTLFVTNIRLVWYNDSNPQFNVSLPYLQLYSVQSRQSKFGRALVVRSCQESGGYMFGFRVDPERRLEEILKCIESLHKVYSDSPIFGVQYSPASQAQPAPQQEACDPGEEPDLEAIDTRYRPAALDSYAAYLADGAPQSCDIDFSAELGLAVERIRPGFTLQSLWQPLPQ